MTKRFTSRSAVLTNFVCGYKRYLTYHALGTGIVPESEALELIIGTVCHRGLQHLFEHCRLHKPDEQLEENCINEAVAKAYEVWNEILQTKQIALHANENDRLSWIIAEQECLFEGLIRAFAIRRLPAILEEYIILEVEKEEVFENFSDLVTFLAKADGLFLRKSDNKIVQLSIKTASTYPEVTERNILHDMQGVSEQVCTNDRLARLYDKFKQFRIVTEEAEEHKAFKKEIGEGLYQLFKGIMLSQAFGQNIAPKVYAVQYEFLLKGQRKQDPYLSGIYKQQNFLCHPYKQEGLMVIGGGGVRMSADNYRVGFGKGKPPKGWDKIDIWEDIGIKNWVEMLARGAVQPEEGNLLDKLLITPSLILRTNEEIEEWKVSTRYSEEQIAKHLDILENLGDCEAIPETEKFIQEAIWKYFPKNILSCHDFYGRDCQFVRHCHERMEINMAFDAGIYIPRESHHEAELKDHKEKGLING